jgi:DNA-binding MarR family transcriptional regulator
MKAIDRRASEFRALQEAVLARLSGLDLTAVSNLSVALTIQEFRSLEFLAHPEARKTKELAEYLGLALNSVTDVVDALEKKGLARRRRDDLDRRIVRVELTPVGGDAAAATTGCLLDIYRNYLNALTPRSKRPSWPSAARLPTSVGRSDSVGP